MSNNGEGLHINSPSYVVSDRQVTENNKLVTSDGIKSKGNSHAFTFI